MQEGPRVFVHQGSICETVGETGSINTKCCKVTAKSDDNKASRRLNSSLGDAQ